MMTYTLEISDQGGLQIPPELLPAGHTYTRYQLEIEGETLILRPQKSEAFWITASPVQRAARFRDWAAQTKRPAAPPLSDEALSRETLYD
jgi:hypothetical protein